MLKYLWRARKFYIIIEAIKAIFNSVFETSSIFLLKLLIDLLTENGNVIFVIIIVILYAVCKKLHEFSFEYIAQIEFPKAKYALNRELTKDIVKKAAVIDLKCYDNTEFYNQYTRALAETGERSMRALNTISSIIYSTISSIGLIALVLTLDPISIVLALFIFVSYSLFLNKNKEIIFERDEQLTQYNRAMNYYKSTFFSRKMAKEIKMYPDIADFLKKEFINTSEKAQQIHMAQTKSLFIYTFIKTFILFLTEYVIPLVYFSFQFLKGVISIGSVTAMWETVKGLAYNFSGIVYSFSELKQSSLYIDNLRYILNYEPQIKNSKTPSVLPNKIDTIKFHNVYFKYEDNKEYILKNLSLTICAHQKIALVGHNGAGKTTLIKLLLRLYEPTDGYISLNGVDIKNYNIDEYRKLFVTMFQDYSLFAAPISVNVLTRMPLCSEDQVLIEKSLRKAGLTDLVKNSSVNRQYSKEFDDEGLVCSGGEEQKLALARVFANTDSASFFILDEPSASLDVESEQQFYNNLFNEVKDKSILLISHKLSTAKDADCIFFLENGQIIEKGTHDELMLVRGRYAHIFSLQAKKYEYETLKNQIEQLNF